MPSMNTTRPGLVPASGPAPRVTSEPLSWPLHLLAGTMRRLPTDIRRFDTIWRPADPYVVGFDPSTPTLIKIEVDGYEVQVLQGLRSLLAWPDVMLVIGIADTKLRRAGHSREELHAILASFGLAAQTIRIPSSRWRTDFEIRPLEGPLATEEYDALFGRPGCAVYRNRIAPVLNRIASANERK